MRVLIIGAGAVGLVYGKHLADGGAEVSLFVRPSRRDEARAGYELTRVSLFGARKTVRFVPHSVVTSASEAEGLEFDQAWVATSTNALDEAWVSELLAAVPRGIVVFLQPGGDVLERMKALVPSEARRVRGAIAMASWASPLDGSREPRELRTPAGIAYLLPPIGGSSFEGPRAPEVVSALARGGCPGRIGNVTVSLALGSGILLPHMLALEVAEWKLARLASRELALLAAGASREALAIASADLQIRPPFGARWLVRAIVTQIAARVARYLTPFDLQTYLRVHFVKVRDQTLLLIAETIRQGHARSLPTKHLEALRARVT